MGSTRNSDQISTFKKPKCSKISAMRGNMVILELSNGFNWIGHYNMPLYKFPQIKKTISKCESKHLDFH